MKYCTSTYCTVYETPMRYSLGMVLYRYIRYGPNLSHSTVYSSSILQVTGELSVQNRRHLYHVRVDPAGAQGAAADAADEEAAVHPHRGRFGEPVLPGPAADGRRGQDPVQAA